VVAIEITIVLYSNNTTFIAVSNTLVFCKHSLANVLYYLYPQYGPRYTRFVKPAMRYFFPLNVGKELAMAKTIYGVPM